MSKEFTFRVHGIKKSGEERHKTFDKINHALKYLWRIKEAQEVYLTAIAKNGHHYSLFAKIGRRRGINRNYAKIVTGLPLMPKAGADWSRLPSRFNEIMDDAKDDRSCND